MTKPSEAVELPQSAEALVKASMEVIVASHRRWASGGVGLWTVVATCFGCTCSDAIALCKWAGYDPEMNCNKCKF